MKYILPFITALMLIGFTAGAQTADSVFAKKWREIDSLITQKELPKSALVKVNALYKDAKAQHLDAQAIKALLYRLSLEDEIKDQYINAVVKTYDAEIAAATNTIQQSILLVLKASALDNFASQNRWRLQGRSTTQNTKKDDITTWGTTDFYTATSNLYTKALQPAQLLQQTGTQQYAAILVKGNAPQLRPTLYDLLANMAIDFYKNQDGNSIEGQYAFTLADTATLAPAAYFMRHVFTTTDTTSRLYQTVRLYQTLLQFHAGRNDTAAFIDADLNRIGWVHDNAAFPNKDRYFVTALQAITQQYTNHPQAAQAWYLLLNAQADKARGYKPFEDTTNRYAFIPVRQKIGERLQAQPAESEGNSHLKQLLYDIEAKELHTQAESVNLPNQPFRLLVQFKNVDTLYGRVISKKLVDALKNKQNVDFWKKVSSLAYVNAFAQPLPQTHDYQQHKVEIKVDGLPAGEYVLLGSSTSNFVESAGRLLTQAFTVSHLSYIQKGNDYFVLDRETGKPLKGVGVTISNNYYNRSSRQWEDRKFKTIITGKDGYFTIPADAKNGNFNIRITLADGKDVLSNENRYYYTSQSDDNAQSGTNAEIEQKNATVHFYLDRAIYRPGQKLYFKGIATTIDAETHKPKLFISAEPLRIYLNDVNGKTVDSVSLPTNPFASVTGSFMLPKQGLTGNFSLQVKDIRGWQSFRVEEYKRPTFYVQLDTLKMAYRLKDTITVTGFAQAFAGNFLNNAQVKYNVQRVTRFNYYGWFAKRRPSGTDKQIAEGSVTTDGSGKFTIKFPALPDETVDTTTSPIFDFAVNTTVTDAGGETREANTTLSVGYASLTVQLNVAGMLDNATFKSIPVSVQNLSGRPVDASVRIKVYPLQSPGRAVHKRYWDRPDVFVMGKEEFIRNFPYDEYESESDVHTWQKASAVIADTFSTSAQRKAYNVKLAAIPQGQYVIEATTTDKDGHEIKDVAYTEVYDASSASVPAEDENFNITAASLLHPGSTASIKIGSAFKDVYVIEQVDKRVQNSIPVSGLQSFKTFVLDGDKKTMEEPVTEADRGGFGLYYAFVKHNRFYNTGQTFIVPWDNKELNIQYTSFRNKTEPGSQEQWKVHIKGMDTGKAELLTAMYDASLDEFAANNWYEPSLWGNYHGYGNWQSNAGFDNGESEENEGNGSGIAGFDIVYDRLAKSSEDFLEYMPMMEALENVKIGTINQDGIKRDVEQENGRRANHLFAPPPPPMARAAANGIKRMERINDIKFTAPKIVSESSGDTKLTNSYTNEGDLIAYAFKTSKKVNSDADNTPLQLRKNFNETAFFFPQVYADSTGSHTVQFTMPESLTKWKWLSLAHTKGLSFGTGEQTIITQKTLMVQPNMPRFLREGDKIELTARISNTGDTALTGQAYLELIDAASGNPVDGLFQNVFPNQYFTAEAGQTTVLKFPVVVPNNYYHPLTYRVVAKTNGFNDGEENTLPVLTNRMLVTESLPLYLKGDTTKHFTFGKLLGNSSETLQTQSLTVEYTANPVWTAVQSLPYLMEYPYECAEQTFNRYNGNTLAAYIIQQHPGIKAVFEQWAADSTALASNLDKNPELKQILLAETPWVLDAQNEAQQRKNIALLFNMVTMANNTQTALQKLQDMQQADGSFAWFKGGYADRHITQYIVTGIGRLQQLHALPEAQSAQINAVATKALVYLDGAANEDYNRLVTSKAKLTDNHLSATAIQYLYMRSYFTQVPFQNKTGYNYFYQQAMQYWQQQTVYMKGMVALMLLRTNQQGFVARNIYPSIIENAVETPERGMYWKESQWGYYWYQAPIEQQALLIELAEAMPADKTLHAQQDADEMKIWLINQKQTTNWKTTKATADACYALLIHSGPQLDANRAVTIQLGSYTLKSSDVKTEAGTGYFKQVVDGKKVQPAMGNITVAVHTEGAVKNTSPSWGAVYWQYLEDMDKITGAATPLSLQKQLFVERNTANGNILTPITADSVLHIGDKVIVRIVLKSDRDMEYLHLKDMRAASMEPQNVLSEYKWQDGLGYYESTKDAATDFFISYLSKGSYVFEYPVFITHTGTFSSGIATIQCMYAPEFASHSEGLRVVVE